MYSWVPFSDVAHGVLEEVRRQIHTPIVNIIALMLPSSEKT